MWMPPSPGTKAKVIALSASCAPHTSTIIYENSRSPTTSSPQIFWSSSNDSSCCGHLPSRPATYRQLVLVDEALGAPGQDSAARRRLPSLMESIEVVTVHGDAASSTE